MHRLWLIVLVGASLLMMRGTLQAQHIRGDYLETRSADVYTGPCFANSEVGLVGDQAILAWRIEQGDWNHTPLQGLSVVGVIKAGATLGDPFSNPYPAKAVIILDDRATAEQQQALLSFVHTMAGKLVANVFRIEAAPISLEIKHDGAHQERVELRVGDVAALETRPISEKDHVCGNEETYYPPLTETAHAMPAVATLDQYNGPDLGVMWTTREKRSAFVGSFAR